jgi:hypothetical protein
MVLQRPSGATPGDSHPRRVDALISGRAVSPIDVDTLTRCQGRHRPERLPCHPARLARAGKRRLPTVRCSGGLIRSASAYGWPTATARYTQPVAAPVQSVNGDHFRRPIEDSAAMRPRPRSGVRVGLDRVMGHRRRGRAHQRGIQHCAETCRSSLR